MRSNSEFRVFPLSPEGSPEEDKASSGPPNVESEKEAGPMCRSVSVSKNLCTIEIESVDERGSCVRTGRLFDGKFRRALDGAVSGWTKVPRRRRLRSTGVTPW